MKTNFTAKRVERLQKSADFELYVLNQKIAANIKRFEEGEQTANQTLRNHRNLVRRFDRICKIELMIVNAANHIDGCEKLEDRYYVSSDYIVETQAYINYCEYFSM